MPVDTEPINKKLRELYILNNYEFIDNVQINCLADQLLFLRDKNIPITLLLSYLNFHSLRYKITDLRILVPQISTRINNL